ncbi:MAG: hypothetical protein Q7T03_04165 [Deltaproteobacteria bacterium]|nr:hypothetical protein [Deltaproteobacteria bacterium]
MFFLKESPLFFSIGRVRFACFWEDPRLQCLATRVYSHFVTEPHTADVSLNLSFGAPGPLPAGEVLFEDAGDWRLVRHNGSFFCETFKINNGLRELRAELNMKLTEGQITLRPRWNIKGADGLGVWYMSQLIHPLGMQLETYHLAAKGEGILCHGAAVADNGEGILFIGRSGRGKSTISGLWLKNSKARVLGDDRIIVKKENGKYWLYPTPWLGNLGHIHPDVVPLKKIYLLEHECRHRFVNKTKPDLLRDFFPNLFLPYWEKGIIEKALSFLDGLLNDIPCVSLEFTPHADVIDFIRGDM